MSSFNYKNYVRRYKYQPYCWPPDLSLAELHARCSQPGPINEEGVQCPCCGQWSKKKIIKWWDRDINEDLKEFGSAIPGYFQLFKYYALCTLLVIFINSIYLIYATFYTCENFDPSLQSCLHVGVIYYLQFSDLVQILNSKGRQNMVDILMILQTTSFYILLATNYFSIIYITFLNDTAKKQFQQLKLSQTSRCLVFYNIPKKVAENLESILRDQNHQNMSIIKKFELYQIKKYYESYQKRNTIYYNLQSLYVVAQDPFKMNTLNKQLQYYHERVLQQREHFNQFSHRVLVVFQNVQQCKLIHSIYKMNSIEKLWIGIQTLLNQFGLREFDHSRIKFCTFQLGFGSETLWQNVGEQLGRKMSIKIKTFFISILFLVLCYIILYYPILFSLRTHVKAQTNQLNTFEKILPNLTALGLVALSVYFRVYMERISEQRNPKDHLEKSRFVLITCLTFHILFYVIIPTVFFMIPEGKISDTVRLYIISQQARTYVVIQVIIVLVDFPYRIWQNKKVSALSDQRIAFRNNQQMLNKIVQTRDFPLQIRLLVLFRLWALVLLYCFFVPYVMLYVIVAFAIIFWVQKYNLYKHYSIRRKVSIKLQSDTLMYFVNFFCLYLCAVYCFTVRDTIKVIAAVSTTVVGLMVNIIYWFILSKGEKKSEEIILSESSQLSKQLALLKIQKLTERARMHQQSYRKFLDSIQNDKLDEEINEYLKTYKEYQQSKKVKNNVSIEMQPLKSEEEKYMYQKTLQVYNQINLIH